MIRGNEECDDPYGPAGSCSDTCTVEWATFPDNPNAEMMKTEVTVQQYRRCVNEGLCEPPRIRTSLNGCNYTAEPGVREFHPVNCLSTEGFTNYETYTGFVFPPRWTGGNCGSGSSAPDRYFRGHGKVSWGMMIKGCVVWRILLRVWAVLERLHAFVPLRQAIQAVVFATWLATLLK